MRLAARKVAKPGDKFILGKPAEHMKIDILMADILAHEAAADARGAGWGDDSGPTIFFLRWTLIGGIRGALTLRDPDHRPAAPAVGVPGQGRWLNLRYYLGRQRVEQLGMAIPPSMRKFLVVANWPRVVVDTMRSRQRMRSMMLAGEDTVNPQLLAARRATNLDAHLAMFETDVLVYGRGFLSCGSNEAAAGSPLVRAESPRQMVAEVDIRTETMLAAARFYGKDEQTGATPTNVTLYLPEVTVWVARGGDGRWVEVDRDPHGLGRVPIVMHLNRRMSGEWAGESEMSDIIPITDAAARSLTNMQFAQESHGIPRMWMTGVAKGDFVDSGGKPIPQFEAYFNAIHTLTKAESKVGQLEASDLKNFETALNVYGSQASIVTGFPSRYFGHFTANPPNEASMKADEAQLVSRVEDQTTQLGVTLGGSAGSCGAS